MTQSEIDRIQEEMAKQTPGELMEAAKKQRAMVERVKKLKKLRKYK